MKSGKSDLGKLLYSNKKAESLTWGAYVILHGYGGVSTHNTSPGQIAKLLKDVQTKIGESWRLKKVCVVGCTLGAPPTNAQEQESWVKQCCDALQIPGALVGGYTVPVYVAYENHPAAEPAFGLGDGLPELRSPVNYQRKLIQIQERDSKTNAVKDIAVRMTENFRAAYKVAWRSNDGRSEPVDINRDWYHQ
ncbi:hypothetical protein [Paraburkholderia sp.]|uniref:hypothetical protein n=1 Tax=Paraburkholderia sp. TaxID=1926495 RepID=UPI0025DFA95C|nr:hypothetical protein [Paraburkholderia sp.]